MYYYGVKQMSMRHESFSESSFRSLIFYADKNGLWPAIKRVGRKVLIDENKFLRWIENPKSLVQELEDVDKNN